MIKLMGAPCIQYLEHLLFRSYSKDGPDCVNWNSVCSSGHFFVYILNLSDRISFIAWLEFSFIFAVWRYGQLYYSN